MAIDDRSPMHARLHWPQCASTGPVQGPGDGHRGRLLLRRRRPPWRRGEPALRVHGAARADPGPEHVQITGILNFNPCLTPNDVILAS